MVKMIEIDFDLFEWLDHDLAVQNISFDDQKWKLKMELIEN